MVRRATGGVISSRVFSAQDLDIAILKLPLVQRKVVWEAVRKIGKKTGLGRTASMEVVAVIGWYLFEHYDSSMDKLPYPHPFEYSTQASSISIQ